MSEFVYRSEDIVSLLKAMAEFDKKEISFVADETGNRNHRYVSKKFILKKTRRELYECNLKIIRSTQTVNDKQYYVTELYHTLSGQFIRSYHFYCNTDKPLDNNLIQSLGGLRTYITRYEIADMLYINDGGIDPDECITMEQCEILRNFIGNNTELYKKVCESYNVSDIQFLLYDNFEKVKKRIELSLKTKENNEL